MVSISSRLRSLFAAPVLFLAFQSLAFAHAGLEQGKAGPGPYKGVVKIGHGCDSSATTQITVTIPDGVIAVKPMPKAGWTLSTRSSAYRKPYDYYHGSLTEGVREITWTGGSLPDAHYDEFVFQAFIAKDVAGGSRLFFPVVQLCEKGRHDWVEIPAGNQDPHALKSPAPSVLVVAANDGATAAGQSQMVQAGDLLVTAARTRVTPAGAPVAGGYLTIRNNGGQPDRLLSASIEIADQTEIHEMATKDGVMSMRSLPDGLVIKPGETVELKPGSFHLMFLKPKRPLLEGEMLKGRLVFERAGAVSVDFKVEGLGSNRAPGGNAPGGKPAGGHSGHVH